MSAVRRSKSSKPLVLLLTHSGDFFTIDRVASAVEARGARAVRIDTDRLPAALSLTLEPTKSGARATLTDGARALALHEATAVWNRRIIPPAGVPSDAPRGAADAAFLLWHDLSAVLTQARWINAPAAEHRADSKLLQLHLAQKLGMTVPRTFVTCDVKVAQIALAGEPAITKLTRPVAWSMEGSQDFVFTERLEAAHLPTLRWRPQLVQPLVEKAKELRAIMVGEQVFVGAFDARSSKLGQLDWRRTEPDAPIAWTKDELPPTQLQLMRKLLDALGLVAGAFDFIVTPKGEHVFLEVNPGGEWGWLERDLGFDISGAIADELVRTKRRRATQAKGSPP